MKPIKDAWMALIDVTNHCQKDCIYCTRFTRHIRKDQKYFMPLEDIKKAIETLRDWPSRKIGIIGGEPSLYPEIENLCDLVREYRNTGLFFQFFTTGGPRYETYKWMIQSSFNFVALNEHSDEQRKVCLHQPLTMAIKDVVKDEELKRYLIDNCWVQKEWCPTINNKGAFFCEVAGAMDIITDGPGGWDVKEGWYLRDFTDQIERYCENCGMPVPLERATLNTENERISPSNFSLYKKLNLPMDRVELDSKEYTLDELKKLNVGWEPANYRQDVGGRGFVRGGVCLK